MSILSFVGQVFKPAADLIDNLHTSDDERLEKKAMLLQIQTDFLTKALEQEQEQLDAKSKIIQAEAQSEGMLARNWRPATMLVFVGLTAAYWFGLTPEGLEEDRVEDMFTLIQIGIGGYIGGRSVEKTAKTVMEALKGREKV